MPKRRRLFTPMKNKDKVKSAVKLELKAGPEVNSARDRLIGALINVMGPDAITPDELDEPASPAKSQRRSKSEEEFLTDEEAQKCLRKSPAKQSYVLKLFDRSVDLSQFRENSPLYPICRAWIQNQPKAIYSTLGSKVTKQELLVNSVTLPPGEGPPVPRVPPLTDQQRNASPDNINLNYREASPPSMDQLLRSHLMRWATVRQAWLDQAAAVEARYEETQKVLNQINRELNRTEY